MNNLLAMHRLNFYIFLRQLFNHGILSLINLLGLSLALLACMLIFMFILHEFQYDTFYDNADETHRLSVEVILPDKTTLPMSTIGGPAAPLLESSYPGVKLATRLQRHGAEFSSENQIFSEENFYTVDENFFEVFNFNILSGKGTEDLLSKPDSIVLTRSLSQRYFGSIDSVGKRIMLNGNTPLEITGVIEDIPSNSHLDGNAFSPFQVLSHQIEDYQNYMSSWWGNGFYTYVVLEESSSIDNLIRNLRSQYADIPDIGLPPGTTFKLHSIPLSEIHMDSHNLDELKVGGNIQLLWIFFSIGACILFIATANFINLSILWFTRRRKETGLKRVIGAQKIELASQFMFESLMLCITCVIFSLLFSYFLAPVFGELLQIELIPELKSRYSIAIALIIFSLMLGFCAGLYPAMLQVSGSPSQILRGSDHLGREKNQLKDTLITAQFFIVMILFSTTLAIQQQLNYISNIDLGFDQNNIVVINTERSNLSENYESFKSALLQNPSIISVASSDSTPLRDWRQSMSTFQPSNQGISAVNIPRMNIDYDYFTLFGIDLIAGRNFSNNYASDLPTVNTQLISGAAIINQSTARLFGWTAQSALNKVLSIGDIAEYHIVGVVGDTIENTRLDTTPMVYILNSPMGGDIVSVSVRGDSLSATLDHINDQWQIYVQDQPIRSSSFETSLKSLYSEDTAQLRLFTLFTFLAITIAILGLYSLIAFTTYSRTREISLRKMYGAKNTSIIGLMTKTIHWKLLIAIIGSYPVSYFIIQRWLSRFTYTVDISIGVYIISGFVTYTAAILTVALTVNLIPDKQFASVLKPE